MKTLIICTTAFLASLSSLFSGFGLGTVLMPVFALFFPLPLAIGATAVIHLLSNYFKLFLVGKWANKTVILQFGIPAALASALGAYLLSLFSRTTPLFTYELFNHSFHITLLGIIVGPIVILSSLGEFFPFKFSFSSGFMPLGGFLSGFFGGLSGNQGAFRSAFLIHAGLTKEQFIGTTVIVSILVDLTRLIVYGWAIYWQQLSTVLSKELQGILLAASLAAFAGAYLGAKWLPALTFKRLKILVAVMLLLLGSAITMGIA